MTDMKTKLMTDISNLGVDILHPILQKNLEKLNTYYANIAYTEDLVNIKAPSSEMLSLRSELLQNLDIQIFGDMFTNVQVPLYSETYCDMLVDYANNSKFQVSPYETPGTQIEEHYLETNFPELFTLSSAIHNEVLTKLWCLINGQRPYIVNSCRMTKYTYGGEVTPNGALHKDHTSPCTTVVELTSRNPSDKEYLNMYPGIKVPVPSKKGYASLFNGRQCAHGFGGVKSTDRYILVYLANEGEIFTT